MKRPIPKFSLRTGIPVAMGFLLIGMGCSVPRPVLPENQTVWMAMQPVQCLSNPWEKDWLKAHSNRGANYPRKREMQIIENFFLKKGFNILDIRLKPYMHDRPIRQVCNTPRGDLVLLRIPETQVAGLQSYGFHSMESPSHAQ